MRAAGKGGAPRRPSLYVRMSSFDCVIVWNSYVGLLISRADWFPVHLLSICCLNLVSFAALVLV